MLTIYENIECIKTFAKLLIGIQENKLKNYFYNIEQRWVKLEILMKL